MGTNQDLETLVDSQGLKIVVAMLADLCHRKARRAAYGTQGDMKGTALDWPHDCISLRQCLMRLKSQKPPDSTDAE